MYRCIEKIKSRQGVTQLYHIIDMDGNGGSKVLTGKELKNLMTLNILQVDNLKISSNGRLIDKKLEEKFYRYFIYDNSTKKIIGGLFRGIDKVIKIIQDEYEEYEDAEDLDLLVSKLEYILKFPKIDRKDIVFYYTEEGNKRVVAKVKQMNEILNYYNFTVKVDVQDDVGRVVYRDQDQVAVVISKKHLKAM